LRTGNIGLHLNGMPTSTSTENICNGLYSFVQNNSRAGSILTNLINMSSCYGAYAHRLYSLSSLLLRNSCFATKMDNSFKPNVKEFLYRKFYDKISVYNIVKAVKSGYTLQPSGSASVSIYLSMVSQPFIRPWLLFFQFLDLFTQSVGLLCQGNSSSQVPTYTQDSKNTEQIHTDIHASSGIRTHDPSV
jgi:hypothetical protein